MNLQLLENPDGNQSDGGARDFSAKAKKERESVAAAKDGDSAAFKIFPTQTIASLGKPSFKWRAR